jgi:DNA-binding transcriptional ArsR family regulator
MSTGSFDALERIFHEPNRLAVMSALCAAEKGLSFRELREITDMTDGNLNRHLKVLREAGAIVIDKQFIDGKPLTTITISSLGLERFSDYLSALEDVLQKARRAISTEDVSDASPAVRDAVVI